MLKKIVRVLYRLLPDKVYLQWLYFRNFHGFINWKNPLGFNEKLNYLKIYDRNNLYKSFADKVEAKKKVAEIIGDEYIIPTYAVWNSIDEIEFSSLPNQFVVKCTHDSGSVLLCRDKSKFDFRSAIDKLGESMKKNSFWAGREWVYKGIKPRIIVEKYLDVPDGEELKDYKVFVFNGKAKFIQVDIDRFTNHRRNFYDSKWNYVPFTTCYPTDINYEIKKPQQLENMIEIAEKISKGLENISFIRVDLYLFENKIYFGETTFYHGGGTEHFLPPEYDEILGRMLDVKTVRKENYRVK